jgi:hypothetical protein
MHDKSADYLAPPSEAAPYAGYAERTFARYRAAGEGPPYIQVKRKIFYRKRDLDAWLDSHRVLPVRERRVA